MLRCLRSHWISSQSLAAWSSCKLIHPSGKGCSNHKRARRTKPNRSCWSHFHKKKQKGFYQETKLTCCAPSAALMGGYISVWNPLALRFLAPSNLRLLRHSSRWNPSNHGRAYQAAIPRTLTLLALSWRDSRKAKLFMQWRWRPLKEQPPLWNGARQWLGLSFWGTLAGEYHSKNQGVYIYIYICGVCTIKRPHTNFGSPSRRNINQLYVWVQSTVDMYVGPNLSGPWGILKIEKFWLGETKLKYMRGHPAR